MRHKNLAEKIKRRWISTQNVVGNEQAHRMFLGAKSSLAKLSDLSSTVRIRVLTNYQTVETEIWGEVVQLPGEKLPLRMDISQKRSL